jgi:hydroxypyruvate isomerase
MKDISGSVTVSKCGNWPIGVCSWSLGNDFDKIAALADQTNLSHIHLAVSPALGKKGKDYLASVQKGRWTISATMVDFPQEDYSTLESIKATGGIVPDKYWQDNKIRVFDAIDLTADLGVKYLSLHFGFIDREAHSLAQKLADRARTLADRAAKKNITLLMETGQESAAELREFLEEINHPSLCVNFDPANMLLYDKGDPVEAVETLSSWIKHVHIKDALRTKVLGTWGQEVPWGSGQVGGDKFLHALDKAGFIGVLTVEREAGDTRFDDIKLAIEKLKR